MMGRLLDDANLRKLLRMLIKEKLLPNRFLTPARNFAPRVESPQFDFVPCTFLPGSTPQG
jgi:hypothetical protein